MPDNPTWITLLILIAGFLWQAYRENRQRRWDKEDRAELARTVVQSAVVVTAHAETENAKLATAIQTTQDKTDLIAVKTEAIREQTNGNLDKVKRDLAGAVERIAALQTLTEKLIAEKAARAVADRRSHP